MYQFHSGFLFLIENETVDFELTTKSFRQKINFIVWAQLGRFDHFMEKMFKTVEEIGKKLY